MLLKETKGQLVLDYSCLSSQEADQGSFTLIFGSSALLSTHFTVQLVTTIWLLRDIALQSSSQVCVQFNLSVGVITKEMFLPCAMTPSNCES